MPFDPTQPFQDVAAPVATLDKSKPFEDVEPGGHNFDPSEVILDPDRGHQHATPVGKAALDSLNRVTPEESEKMRAVSQLYVSQQMQNSLPIGYVADHWDAVRDSYAKSLGFTGNTISEGAFNTLLQQDIQKNKKQAWSTADTNGRLKQAFGDSGFTEWKSRVDTSLPERGPAIGSEAAGTKGEAFTIPKMQGTGTFVGIINSVNKAISGLTTEENLGILAVTEGAGFIADIAQSAQVVAVAKATQAAAVGTFAVEGGASTVDQVSNAIKVTHDPASTHAQIAEAWADAGLSAAMTAAAAKGTYDFGKGATEATLTPEKKTAVADALRKQAEQAPSAELASTLTAAADHIEHAPEEGAAKDKGAVQEFNDKLDKIPGGPKETPVTVEGKEPTHPPLIERSDGLDYGIAARVTEARAEHGAIDPIEPGKGISAEDSVLHGRDLLEKGADPQEALSAFQKDGKISADQVALVRAHGETLNKAAYDAEIKFGPDSPEYKAAAKADSDWIAAIKPMQTEWHKIGQAQQGQTEMDTGTFHGINRAFKESTGREFTPKEAEVAKKKVAKVQEATGEVAEASKKFVEGAKAAAEGEEPPAKVAKWNDRVSEAKARVLARLEKLATKQFVEGEETSGILSKENLNDLALVGADYIKKGVKEFGAWSEAMIKDFGEKIKPHLDAIFAKSQDAKSAERGATVMSHVPGEKWTPEQSKALWQHAKENYLDKGITDPHDIRSNLATDFGLDSDEIHKGLGAAKGMREITDEVYAKQAAQRRVINEAKRWVADAKYPGYERIFRAIPESFFNLYTFGHGTVWTVTHTGNQYFLPKATARLFRDLGRSFRLMGVFDGGAYHERMMNDLIRDPNFIKAKRAGLENDPYLQRDEYTNPGVVKMFKQIGLMGNRGFDGMKLFRQFRFNQEWNALPESLKNADTAKFIANDINTATGAVPSKSGGKVASTIFFAPRLEMSRWKFMFTDPAMNVNTIAKALVDKNSVTPEAYHAAQRNLRQKLTIAGTYFGLLAINQGLLTATGSDQEINFADYRKGDWLDFKAFDKSVGVVSPMKRTVQFLMELANDFWGKRTPLEKAEGSRYGQVAGDVGDYVRGKLSPFAGVTTDVLTQSDFMGRPMPFSSDKASKRGRKAGGQYTYGEYASQKLLPIPFAEAARELWKQQGMDDSDVSKWLKAIEAGAISGGTGAKMRDDSKK